MSSRSPKPESRAARAAIARVSALELPLPKKPIEEGSCEWPHNLSDLTDDQLANQLTYWAGIASYAAFHVAREDVERKSFERARSHAWTRALLSSDAGSVTEKKAYADTHPVVVEAEKSVAIHDSMYKMLKAVFEGYQSKYAAASRELSRRLKTFERGLD